MPGASRVFVGSPTVPIRLRQALGFARHGAAPRPLFGAIGRKPHVIRRGFGASPQAGAAHKARSDPGAEPGVNRIGTLGGGGRFDAGPAGCGDIPDNPPFWLPELP